MCWLVTKNSSKIFHNGQQVAEILVEKDLMLPKYLIRNKRPNGTVGFCFDTYIPGGIKVWLDEHYPGWTRGSDSKS